MTPHVQFTPHLLRSFPALEEGHVSGATVAEVLSALDREHPGVRGFLVDDQGALRPHVAVFVNERPVEDRQALGDPVEDGDDLYIFQARTAG